jgi:hypothetical protein
MPGLGSGWLQRTSLDSLKSCRLCPGCGLEAAFRRRRYGYFFFLEVFFATFLLAALAVFFAFFAFLAMSSSVKSRFNEYAHAVHRHAHDEAITNSNFYQGVVKLRRRCQADRHRPAHAGGRRGRRDHRLAGATRRRPTRRRDNPHVRPSVSENSKRAK